MGHLCYAYCISTRNIIVFWNDFFVRIWSTGIDVDPFNRATWKDLRFDQKECVFSFYYQYGCKRGFSVRNNYKKPRRVWQQ